MSFLGALKYAPTFGGMSGRIAGQSQSNGGEIPLEQEANKQCEPTARS
jgi:hypothetical protein